MVTPRSVNAQRELNTASIHEAEQIKTKVDPIINVINSKLAE